MRSAGLDVCSWKKGARRSRIRERWVGGEEDLIACRARSFLEMSASSEICWRVKAKLKGERETSVGTLRVDWVGREVSSQVKGNVG